MLGLPTIRRTRFVLLQPMMIIATSCGGGLFTRPSPYCDSVCRQEEAINPRIWLRRLYLVNSDVLRFDEIGPALL